MKKNLLLLLFLGLILSSFAQTTMMQRKMIPGKVDTLLINYFTYSKFSSLDDIGYSDAVANQFKFLFTPNARITDEVNPSYYDKDYDHPFDLPSRSLDDYLAKTKENYPNGLFVKYNALQVDYANLSITMLKETNGTTRAGLLYKVTDTLKMKLNLSADLKTLKIQDISVMGYSIVLANDDDRDFIPNAMDKCPKEQGFRSGTGCFTKEEKAAFAIAEKDRKLKEKENKGVAVNEKPKEKPKEKPREKPKVQPSEPSLPGIFVGLTLSGGINKFTTTFREDNLAYNNLIKGNAGVYSVTGLKQKKQVPFTQVQVDLDFFFGKKKNIGIATGIGLSSFNPGFDMDTFHVEYQATDAAGHNYRRVVHVHNMGENLKMKSINIPIILQYKIGPVDKSNVALGVGVNYHKVNSANVSATATADYEAIYNYDQGINNPTFDPSVIPGKTSYLITRSNVEAHGGTSNEQDYFAQKNLCGYDVAIDKGLTKEESLSVKSSMGLILRANANLILSKKLWLAVLLQYQSISFTNNSATSSYKLTDETGSYNVMLKNVNTLKAGILSLGVGIKYCIK